MIYCTVRYGCAVLRCVMFRAPWCIFLFYFFSSSFLSLCAVCLTIYVMLWYGMLCCTEIAKARATASNVGSIEELAMHRALSEYLFQTFAKPNTVESVRRNMIDAAAAVAPRSPSPPLSK